MEKKNIKYILILIIALILLIILRPIIAHQMNNYLLKKMEKEISSNFPLNENLITQKSNRINGNEYFAIPKSNRDNAKAKCNFNINLHFENISEDDLNYLENYYKKELGKSYDNINSANYSYINSDSNKNTLYFDINLFETPHVKKYTIINYEIPLPFFSPINLYDKRCRTKVLMNTA